MSLFSLFDISVRIEKQMKPFDRTSRQRLRRFAAVALALSLSACLPAGDGEEGASLPGVVMASSISVAHTPPGGYGKTFPAPVLATCTEPLSPGAPDLRGIWKVLRAERGGKPAPAGDRIYGYVERIEQCGNRIVDMGGGTVSDGRADGSYKNAIHDVSAFGYTKPIHVIVTYEKGVFVLRPGLLPKVPFTVPGLKVTRALDAEGHMVWTRPDRGGLHVTLERIGGPNGPYTRQ
jgi:hypothetical protein